jgi:hypothetical protein
MHCPLYNIHRQLLLDSFNKLSIEFTIQTILYGSETSDYNEFSLVLNILREGLDFVEAGRPFQSRNVQGMKLLLYETVLQKGSLKLSPDICCRRL